MGIHGIRHSTSVSKRVSLAQSAVKLLSEARRLFSGTLRCIFCACDDAGIDQAIIPSRIALQKSCFFGLAWELRGSFQIGRLLAMWRTIPIWGELNERPLKSESGENKMLGWLTVFAMLALCSLLIMLGGTTAIIIPAVIASSLFAFLFFVFLLTTAIRGRP
jgi:hypothetical protein